MTLETTQIESIITKYYTELFTSQHSSSSDIRYITDLISPSITNEINDNLNVPFIGEDVRKALFDINPKKAPGLDGYTALFFQREWDIVGGDVTKAVLGVFNRGQPLDHWNPTIIILIHKSKTHFP